LSAPVLPGKVKAAARGAVLVGSIGFCAAVLNGYSVFWGLQALMLF